MAAGVAEWTIPPGHELIRHDLAKWVEWMSGKRKEVEPDLPSWRQPGTESAVVYEDELPWNKDKGICFEIHERREYAFEPAGLIYVWRVKFGDKWYDYFRRVDDDIDSLTETRLDWYRRDARIAILTNAHRDGVI